MTRFRIWKDGEAQTVEGDSAKVVKSDDGLIIKIKQGTKTKTITGAVGFTEISDKIKVK